VFRQPGIKALERSGRRWRLALTSPSLTGLAITIRTTLGLRPAIGHHLDGQVICHSITHPAVARLREILLDELSVMV
jgi:hypothetical protein